MWICRAVEMLLTKWESMKVRVRDEKSGAEAETGIQFEMVADEGLAAGVK